MILIFIIVGFTSCSKDPLPAVETIPVEESKSMTTVEIQNSTVIDSCALLVLKPGIDKKLYQLDKETNLVVRELETATEDTAAITLLELFVVAIASFLLGMIVAIGALN